MARDAPRFPTYATSTEEERLAYLQLDISTRVEDEYSSTDDDGYSSTDDEDDLSSDYDDESSTADDEMSTDDEGIYSSSDEDGYTRPSSRVLQTDRDDEHMRVPIRPRDEVAVRAFSRPKVHFSPTISHEEMKVRPKTQEKPPYRYQHLEDPERQMRVVTVHSFKGYPIRCSMKAITRNKAKEDGYRALSYHWGAPNPKSAIRIDGREFLVQKNLHEFLDHASRMKAKGAKGWTTGRFWIDAICIDQEDNEEKAVQLKHIRRMYRHAGETIIWLGPGDSGTADAMRYIKKQCKAAQKALEDDSVTEYLADSRDFLIYDKSLVIAMDVILSNPYWSRVWILQEIAVSDRARVNSSDKKERIRMVCGNGEVPWSFFMQFAMCIPLLKLDNQDRAILKLQKKVKKKQAVWLLSYLHGEKSCAIPGLKVVFRTKPRLGLLVYLSEQAFSTQGQDYIYALLGLIVKGRGKDIVPQPNRSGCSVICDAIRRIVKDAKKGRKHRDFPYVEKLEELAKEARHKPLDRTPGMEARRRKCSGRFCQDSGCRCNGHCNALDVCRKMARLLYGHKILLTVRYGGKMFKIGRDKIKRRSYTRSGALRDSFDSWRQIT